MKSSFLLILILISVITPKVYASPVKIGDKLWNQLWGGPYSSVSTWVEMASIFDPITGACMSNQCGENEYWASVSDIQDMYNIAGPDGLSGFSDTFADPPFFSVIHGVARDFVVRDLELYAIDVFIRCNTGNMLSCNPPSAGNGLFTIYDDFRFTQGVYIGVWTYEQLQKVNGPNVLLLVCVLFPVFLLARKS